MPDVHASSPVQPGEVLAGKYRVERVLGVGGMGVVVAAIHLQLGERVALKFLLDDAAKRPETIARFLREAQAAVRIKSEHVARIIDVGTLASGAPFMVMEYLAGRDLSALLESKGRLSIEQAVGYVLQASEAVAEAHSLGIVHRDLKPSNLFLTRRADGSHLVKVLDFGISKATLGSQEKSLTVTHGVMGSPLYMSPEQVRSSKHVDARADVWSLGVILFELLTGSTPFVAETVSGLLAAIVADAPIALRTLMPEAPPALDAILRRALEKEVSRRWSSVAELAVALLPFGPPTAHVSVDRISNVLRGNAVGDGEDPISSDDARTQLLAFRGEGERPSIATGLVPSTEPSPGGMTPTPHAPASPTRVSGGATAGSWGKTNEPSSDAVVLPTSKTGLLVALGASGLAAMGLGAFIVSRLVGGSAPVTTVSAAAVSAPAVSATTASPATAVAPRESQQASPSPPIASATVDALPSAAAPVPRPSPRAVPAPASSADPKPKASATPKSDVAPAAPAPAPRSADDGRWK